MQFVVDPSAPRMAEDYCLLTTDEVAPILQGAAKVWGSDSGGPRESWCLTRGGQFVRRNGPDLSRCYVVPADDAFSELAGLASEETLTAIRTALPEHLRPQTTPAFQR